jgi:hypothetical protein
MRVIMTTTPKNRSPIKYAGKILAAMRIEFKPVGIWIRTTEKIVIIAINIRRIAFQLVGASQIFSKVSFGCVRMPGIRLNELLFCSIIDHPSNLIPQILDTY